MENTKIKLTCTHWFPGTIPSRLFIFEGDTVGTIFTEPGLSLMGKEPACDPFHRSIPIFKLVGRALAATFPEEFNVRYPCNNTYCFD